MNPDWHDYPTGRGQWVMTWMRFQLPDTIQWSVITVYAIHKPGHGLYMHNGRPIPIPKTHDPSYATYRYYGPLPPDPQGETN